MADLAIITPTLGRPKLLAPLTDNIIEATPPRFRLIFVVDHDDGASITEVARLAEKHEGVVGGLGASGTYPEKCNAGARATSEPLLFIANDDVRYSRGWLEAAEEQMRDGIGVVGTNDLHNKAVLRGEQGTQLLVARWYFEVGGAWQEPETIYFEGYHHDGSDLELSHLARHRGAYAHAHDSVVEHLHPAWGLRSLDATDRKGQRQRKQSDRALFAERRAAWESAGESWERAAR